MIGLRMNIDIEERQVEGRGIPFGKRRVFVVCERSPDTPLSPTSEWRVYSRRVAARIAWERQQFWRVAFRRIAAEMQKPPPPSVRTARAAEKRMSAGSV